jgi:hypothetical protein
MDWAVVMTTTGVALLAMLVLQISRSVVRAARKVSRILQQHFTLRSRRTLTL